MKYSGGGGLRCHDIHTKFNKDWCRHSIVNRGEGIQRHTAWRSHKPTFIFFFKEGK
jgi:hypothetical protein